MRLDHCVPGSICRTDGLGLSRCPNQDVKKYAITYASGLVEEGNANIPAYLVLERTSSPPTTLYLQGDHNDQTSRGVPAAPK